MTYRCRICRNPIDKRVTTPFGTLNLCEPHAEQVNAQGGEGKLGWYANPPFDPEVSAWLRACLRWSLGDPIEEVE